MRTFASGATRDDNQDKLAFEGFLSPEVLYGYARYMHKHRKQADGKMRAADNWQKGIPFDALMDSLLRHVFEVWRLHRQGVTDEERADMYDALYATMFNTMGYVFEMIKEDEEREDEWTGDPLVTISTVGLNPPPSVEVYRIDNPPADLKTVDWAGEMKVTHYVPTALTAAEQAPTPAVKNVTFHNIPTNLGNASLPPPNAFAVDSWRKDCEDMLDQECKE